MEFARIPHLVALALALVTLTSARPVGAQDTPVFDDAYLLFNLDNDVTSQSGNQPAQVTYRPQIRMRFFGAAEGDAVKVRWKQGRRTLAEIRCPLEASHGTHRTTISQRCWSQGEVALEAHGDVQVELIFVDDSADTETPVRTLSVSVGRFWRVDRSGNPTVHSVRYQVRPLDMLGLSYVYLVAPEDTEAFGNVYFYTWASLANDRSNYSDPSWRCSLNGERVAELEVRDDSALESIGDTRVYDDQVRGRNERSTVHYAWRQMWIKPRMVWGSRNPATSDLVGNTRYNISEHPGDYMCQLRNAGEMVREFRFTVNEQGSIAPHPAQTQGELSLRPGAFFVDTRFAGQNDAEAYFDRDAVRSSVAFGRSWPNDPAVRSFLDALPRSFGASEPAVPRDRRGRQRRRGR